MTVAALAGIRVLDFTTVMAGPYCTRMLAGLGADVIKVEPPSGDPIRKVEPIRDGHSAYFAALNAGKRSVVLDLTSPDDMGTARELANRADVIVENFRVGVLARYGLDYETLAVEHPELVYCSVSGFGQTGPDADRHATAQVVQAVSGFDAAFASYQSDPGAMPTTGVWVADGLAGALAVSAVLAALRIRDTTGVGRHIDLPLEDGLLSILIHEVQSSQFPTKPTTGYRPMRSADGYVMISAVSPKTFTALCGAIDQPELATDDRYRDPVQRRRNLAEFQAILEKWTAQRSGLECERVLRAAGVPAARYRTVDERLADPGVRARGVLTPARDGAGNLSVFAVPYRFASPAAVPLTPSDTRPLTVPELGADTSSVLAELKSNRKAMT